MSIKNIKKKASKNREKDFHPGKGETRFIK